MLPDKPLIIGAVVLAAGLSSRMGVQKLLLPWKEKTVIEKVVDTLINSGISNIVVVTGRDAEQIASTLKSNPVQVVYNPDFADGNMVTSLRTGLKALREKVDGILMVLADQPQMMDTTVKLLVNEWNRNPDSICIPSYQMHRGHPWVIPARLWDNLNGLDSHQTMRDFIRINEMEIRYVVVETPTILADLDTPEDYEKQKNIREMD
jgi:molybdenum cofactor cytidylyltransferase